MKHFQLKLLICSLIIGITNSYAAEKEALEADPIEVTGAKNQQLLPPFPGTVVSTSASQIADTVNAMDTPDALKYLPSLMVRKRDSADYGGATLATRIWGVSYSAKSIVNVDGMPISTQLYNDNNYGPPKWFMVSPEEIKSIDVMYGPFSAAYSGNSMGAVVNINTQLPEKFTAIINTTGSYQTFNKFGTNDNYLSGQMTALIGDKSGDLSWRLSVNHADANTQPRAFVTGQNINSSGGYATSYPYYTKTGTNGNGYDGATAFLHGTSDSANLRLLYSITPSLKLGLNTGLWQANTNSSIQSYLDGGTYQTFSKSNTSSASTYYGCSNTGTSTSGAGVTSPACTPFASGIYSLAQRHYMNGVTLTSDDGGDFNWQYSIANVYYDQNLQRSAGATNIDGAPRYDYAGTVSDYSGSGWTTTDWRGNLILGEGDTKGKHVLSFGLHYDYNRLNNTQYTTTNWNTATSGTVSAIGKGVTTTSALWVQDAWRLNEVLRLTTGLRYENWNSFDGQVLSAGNTATPSRTSFDAFSPKVSLLYDAPHDWLITTSLAGASRFPTPGELFNVVAKSAGTCANGALTCTYAPSNLNPEDVRSAEISFEKQLWNGFFRTSFFAEDVRNALISQVGYPDTNNPNAAFSTWQNVKKVRSYGVEFASQLRDVVLKGLDLGGSITVVDSTILDNDGLTSTYKPTVGNPIPGVSPLKVTTVMTYRPDEKWAFTVAGRYQRQFASSLDNNDVNANTYLGFSGFFVVDLKARYQIDKNLRASFGIDNVNNRDYFLFHPFPQRTFVANLRYSYD
ncbi:MAG: TonB-dependent receptor [Betaproteobacteria bacterium]|jgi:iron complex outermembrane receptor protein